MQTENLKRYFWLLIDAALVLVVLGGLLGGLPVLKKYKSSLVPARVFSVTSEGKTTVSPDIAKVSFSVVSRGQNPETLSETNNQKMQAVIENIKANGVEAKDIKTTGYNLSPKYEWQEQRIVCITYHCNQPPGKQVLTGYEVTQSVEVKIRDLDDAGTILGGLSDNGATNVSGLNFLVENEDSVQREAREEAITKAKTKAEELAKDLDVSLVRIVSFNEGGNYPVYYGRAEMKLMSADAGASVAADIPVGENKYTSNVTIVYEIK